MSYCQLESPFDVFLGFLHFLTLVVCLSCVCVSVSVTPDVCLLTPAGSSDGLFPLPLLPPSPLMYRVVIPDKPRQRGPRAGLVKSDVTAPTLQWMHMVSLPPRVLAAPLPGRGPAIVLGGDNG